jgi:hypothetical protein
VHTILIHYTHTLYSYTILIHYTHTLYSYTILIHYTHTLGARFKKGSKTFLISQKATMAAMRMVMEQDMRKYGMLTPFAVHLHMHDHGTRMWMDHYRLSPLSGNVSDTPPDRPPGLNPDLVDSPEVEVEWRKIGEYGRIDHYRGVGKDEGFFQLQTHDPATHTGSTAGAYSAEDATIISGVPVVTPDSDGSGAWDYFPFWSSALPVSCLENVRRECALQQGPACLQCVFAAAEKSPKKPRFLRGLMELFGTPGDGIEGMWTGPLDYIGCRTPEDLCAACVAQPDEFTAVASGIGASASPSTTASQSALAASITGTHPSTATSRQLGPSDTFSINCVLNTESKTVWTKTPEMAGDQWMHTAMDKGDEMCGSLLMYYPHDPTARFNDGSIIGGGDSSHFQTTMCVNYDLDNRKCAD